MTCRLGPTLTGRDMDDRLLFWIGAGYVQFDREEVAVGGDGVRTGVWLPLSCNQPWEHGPKHVETKHRPCPKCLMYPLTASGVCMGGCDE